jgi:hypothetical protein
MPRPKKVKDAEQPGEQLPIDAISGVGPAAAGPEPDAPRSAPPSGAPRERITILLTETGAVDLSSMRDATRQKFKDSLKKTEELKDSAPVANVPDDLPDEAIGALYNILGTIETMAAARWCGPEIAARYMPFTPEEIAILTDPTKRVLIKHVGTLGRWQDETALVMILVQLHFQKFHAMKSAMPVEETAAAAKA